MRLQGKVAIVTGAASGIGRATAVLFGQEGARVMCADLNGEGARAAAEAIAAQGGEAAWTQVDVSREEDVQRMVQETVQRFGRLDILFNNAGVEGEQAPTADCSLENWERVINVNLRGVFLGMKYAIPEMLKAGGGVIINTASQLGLVGFAGMPAYCASKGGVIQLTRTAALEYARQNIRVNAICPGLIWTPMLERYVAGKEDVRKALTALEPIGRLGLPEEVARLALFLASDDSSFCTGAPFIVDGGFVAA